MILMFLAKSPGQTIETVKCRKEKKCAANVTGPTEEGMGVVRDEVRYSDDPHLRNMYAYKQTTRCRLRMSFVSLF